jgi:hypothetical protein
MANEKHKRVNEIADELDQLASKFHDPSLKEVAAQLRKSVSSKETSNESNEGNEGQGTTTTQPPTGGPQPPPDKERP